MKKSRSLLREATFQVGSRRAHAIYDGHGGYFVVRWNKDSRTVRNRNLTATAAMKLAREWAARGTRSRRR